MQGQRPNPCDHRLDSGCASIGQQLARLFRKYIVAYSYRCYTGCGLQLDRSARFFFHLAKPKPFTCDHRYVRHLHVYRYPRFMYQPCYNSCYSQSYTAGPDAGKQRTDMFGEYTESHSDNHRRVYI